MREIRKIFCDRFYGGKKTQKGHSKSVFINFLVKLGSVVHVNELGISMGIVNLWFYSLFSTIDIS